jgi:signal recognition particle subunit SEC65
VSQKKQEEVNSAHQRRDGRMRPRNLTLKNLLIEPIKQIARYVKSLRVSAARYK